MKKFLSTLLSVLGLYRPAPTTPLGRALRRTERAALLVAALYIGLQMFPQVLFAHYVTSHDITVYSQTPLPPETEECLARAAALLGRCELAVPGRPERVFVCNSPWLFRFFGPTSAHAFAFSLPGTDNVFVAQADFARDQSRRAASAYYTRRLSGVIAHEITHGLIRHRLGLARGLGLPLWVAEGYCDYVAGDGSFPEAQGLALLASGQHDDSPSFEYFSDRQMVRYLIEERHCTFEQVVARAYARDAVADETRAFLRGDPPR